MPTLMPWSAWGWTAFVKLLCEGFKVVKCAEIWSVYITDEAACALKDFDKEWREDEEAWQTHRQELKWTQEQERSEVERRKRATERQREFEDMQMQNKLPTADAER